MMTLINKPVYFSLTAALHYNKEAKVPCDLIFISTKNESSKSNKTLFIFQLIFDMYYYEHTFYIEIKVYLF